MHDWIECQNAMKGHNNMFKGFMDDESAYKWLSKITSKQEEHHNEIVKVQKEKKRADKKKKQNEKQFSFYLDRKHALALDGFLKTRKVTLDNYIKEIIELDLMDN